MMAKKLTDRQRFEPPLFCALTGGVRPDNCLDCKCARIQAALRTERRRRATADA